MAKKEAAEYQAKVTNDSGILRGKIPSPLVRELGARAGDYIVFRSDGAGNVRVSLSRSRSSGGKKAGKGSKGGAKKNGRRGR
ncbi:MAG TPA: hypothetical protein VF708_16425 [Pyrinomonadaceae bacterium]|jgi:hypothetical protein